MVDAEQHCQ